MDIYRDFINAPRATEPVHGVVGKFFVSAVNLSGDYGGTVKLSAVSRGARNVSWASATPSGTIEMFVSNKSALAEFLKALHHTGGPEFLVTFSHAPIAHSDDGHSFVSTPQDHYNAPNCAECGARSEDHVG